MITPCARRRCLNEAPRMWRMSDWEALAFIAIVMIMVALAFWLA